MPVQTKKTQKMKSGEGSSIPTSQTLAQQNDIIRKIPNQGSKLQQPQIQQNGSESVNYLRQNSDRNYSGRSQKPQFQPQMQKDISLSQASKEPRSQQNIQDASKSTGFIRIQSPKKGGRQTRQAIKKEVLDQLSIPLQQQHPAQQSINNNNADMLKQPPNYNNNLSNNQNPLIQRSPRKDQNGQIFGNNSKLSQQAEEMFGFNPQQPDQLGGGLSQEMGIQGSLTRNIQLQWPQQSSMLFGQNMGVSPDLIPQNHLNQPSNASQTGIEMGGTVGQDELNFILNGSQNNSIKNLAVSDASKVLSPPPHHHHRKLVGGGPIALAAQQRGEEERVKAEGDADLFARFQGGAAANSVVSGGGLSVDRISYDALFGSRYDSATDEDYEVMEDIIQNPKAYRNDLKPYVVNISKAEVADLRKQNKKTKSHFTDDDENNRASGEDLAFGNRRYKTRRTAVRSIFQQSPGQSPNKQRQHASHFPTDNQTLSAQGAASNRRPRMGEQIGVDQQRGGQSPFAMVAGQVQDIQQMRVLSSNSGRSNPNQNINQAGSFGSSFGRRFATQTAQYATENNKVDSSIQQHKGVQVSMDQNCDLKGLQEQSLKGKRGKKRQTKLQAKQQKAEENSNVQWNNDNQPAQNHSSQHQPYPYPNPNQYGNQLDPMTRRMQLDSFAYEMLYNARAPVAQQFQSPFYPMNPQQMVQQSIFQQTPGGGMMLSQPVSSSLINFDPSQKYTSDNFYNATLTAQQQNSWNQPQPATTDFSGQPNNNQQVGQSSLEYQTGYINQHQVSQNPLPNQQNQPHSSLKSRPRQMQEFHSFSIADHFGIPNSFLATPTPHHTASFQNNDTAKQPSKEQQKENNDSCNSAHNSDQEQQIESDHQRQQKPILESQLNKQTVQNESHLQQNQQFQMGGKYGGQFHHDQVPPQMEQEQFQQQQMVQMSPMQTELLRCKLRQEFYPFLNDQLKELVQQIDMYIQMLYQILLFKKEDQHDEENRKGGKEKATSSNQNQKSEKLNELLPSDDLESIQNKENARKKSKEKQQLDSMKEQRRQLIQREVQELAYRLLRDFKQRRDAVLSNLHGLPKYEVPWMRIPSQQTAKSAPNQTWQSLEVHPQVSYLQSTLLEYLPFVTAQMSMTSEANPYSLIQTEQNAKQRPTNFDPGNAASELAQEFNLTRTGSESNSSKKLSMVESLTVMKPLLIKQLLPQQMQPKQKIFLMSMNNQEGQDVSNQQEQQLQNNHPVMPNMNNRRKFSVFDDQCVLLGLNEFGFGCKNVEVIQQNWLPNKTVKEIGHRIKNLTCQRVAPNILKAWKFRQSRPLSARELFLLAQGLKWFGDRTNRWTIISKSFIPDRTPTFLRVEFANSILLDPQKAQFFGKLKLADIPEEKIFQIANKLPHYSFNALQKGDDLSIVKKKKATQFSGKKGCNQQSKIRGASMMIDNKNEVLENNSDNFDGLYPLKKVVNFGSFKEDQDKVVNGDWRDNNPEWVKTLEIIEKAQKFEVVDIDRIDDFVMTLATELDLAKIPDHDQNDLEIAEMNQVLGSIQENSQQRETLPNYFSQNDAKGATALISGDRLRLKKDWQDWSAADDDSSSELSSCCNSSSEEQFLVKQEERLSSLGIGGKAATGQESAGPDLRSLDSKKDRKSQKEYKRVSMM